MWLTEPDYSDVWRPQSCKMVVYVEAGGNRLAVHVDPSVPHRWKERPYYSQIKTWATHALQNQMQVVVYIADKVTVVFPHKDADLGFCGPGDHIQCRRARGQDWEAVLVRAENVRPEDQNKWIVGVPSKA